MSYDDVRVSTAIAAMDERRSGEAGEIGAALVIVGLSAERVAKEAQHARTGLTGRRLASSA